MSQKGAQLKGIGLCYRLQEIRMREGGRLCAGLIGLCVSVRGVLSRLITKCRS